MAGVPLASLPSVDALLRSPGGDALIAAHGRAPVTQAVREVLAGLRSSRSPLDEPAILARAKAILEKRSQPTLRAVFNLTGTVLHTNLGRALLPEEAIEAMTAVARSPSNLEYDLDAGRRGERDTHVEKLVCELTGAEAATVVNNNAAAVLLGLTALAEGREVIVSRGELIEIGGSFRLPDVMARSGARLREVGTTNRTHPRDYEAAITADTALLLKVHPSNYRVVGFTSEVTLEELVAIGRSRGIPVMEDLGAGALVDMSAYGLPREPIVAERVAAGADVVTFSGDKLLGGPQAGIVVGRREMVGKLKRNALKRALRCDKLTLAALSATLRLYLRSSNLSGDLPTLRFLTRSVSEMKQMAPRARDILAERLGQDFRVEVIESSSQIGSGALPTEELPTVALRVIHPRLSPDAIADIFRRARIIGRVSDDAFQLDLRTVEDPAAFAVSFKLPE